MAKIQYRRTSKALKDWGKILVATLKKKMREKKLVASRATVNSISYNFQEKGDVLSVEILGRQKGNYQILSILDKGRGKNLTPPPVDAIQMWIEDKKIKSRKPGRSSRQLAHAISKSIGVKGTIDRFGGGSNIFDESFRPIQDEIGEDILRAYGDDVQAYIDKHLPKQNTRRT